MRRLVFAWLALMALAGASWAASYLHLGKLGVLVAILIAGVKAVVVGLIFMELIDERPSTRFVALTAIALLVVFIGLVAADPATRDAAPATAHVIAP